MATQPAPGEEGGTRALRLGICALDKKAFSRPMMNIKERLAATGDFEIVDFGDDVILHSPIDQWPPCDCLICFHSSGFPLAKAEAYVKIQQPLLINSLREQWWLLDRRKVALTLERCGIATPRSLFVNRDDPDDPETFPWTRTGDEDFIEGDDYIAIKGGPKLFKPFVEKPVDSNRHDLRIYFPSSAGGGVKELFRKKADRCGNWLPDVNRVRRDGSYVYEAYVPTGGVDIKVYAIAPGYAHAEGRKSPAVDGRVERDVNGKEVRHAVLLLESQKQMATKITSAFRQGVCGFDILYTPVGNSYVCDVNGFSFVKGSKKYENDAACLLHAICVASLRPARFLRTWDERVASCASDAASAARRGGAPSSSTVSRRVSPSGAATATGTGEGFGYSSTGNSDGEEDELLAVIIIARHGDRTPKLKAKLTTQDPAFLELFRRWAPPDAVARRGEVKLKRPRQLRDAQAVVNTLIEAIEESDRGRSTTTSSCETDETDDDSEHKLRLMREVLAEGGHFSGLNRKLQLKVKEVIQDDDGVKHAKSLLSVLKYGGLLTPCGCAQAEAFGRDTCAMFPGGMAGLQRLHSTFRLDFRCYSSDEGRVQQTAAYFIRAFLGLDAETGDITPILFNFVSIETRMLDETPRSVDAAILRARLRTSQIVDSDPDAKRELKHLAACLSSICTHLRDLYYNALSHVQHTARMLSDDGSDGSAEEGGHGDAAVSPLRTPQPQDVISPTPRRILKRISSDKQSVRALLTLMPSVDPEVHTSTSRDEVEQLTFHTAGQGSLPKSSSGANLIEMQGEHSAIDRTYSDASDRLSRPALGESLYSAWMRWSGIRRAFVREPSSAEASSDAPAEPRYDLSRISDIFDSTFYDVTHNWHLNLPGLGQELFPLIKHFALRVIPNEYGGLPFRRLSIGTRICAPLLAKIHKDITLASGQAYREIVSPSKSRNSADGADPEQCSGPAKSLHRVARLWCGASDEAAAALEILYERATATVCVSRTLSPVLLHQQNSVPKTSPRRRETWPRPETTADVDEPQFVGDGEPQSFLFLDAREAESKGIRTASRRVVVRAHFTSESHISAFLNTLRYAHLLPDHEGSPLVSDDAEQHLASDYLGYLSAVVIRVLRAHGEESDAVRVEMDVSTGARLDAAPGRCPPLAQRRRLHHPDLTLSTLLDALDRAGRFATCSDLGDEE